MTFVLGILTSTFALALGVFLGRRHERHIWVQIVAARATADTGKIRNFIEYRVAVHEAGHAICVWHNPYTKSLDRITIDDGAVGEGEVLYTTRTNNDTSEFWHRLAVNLGGIAAELLEFKRVRSGTAKTDLVKALQNARLIAKAGSPTPPWDKNAELPEGHFNVGVMFRSISPTDARVLNLAYAHARKVLEKDRGRMLQVAGDLARHGVLEAPDLKRIFGTRFVWSSLR